MFALPTPYIAQRQVFNETDNGGMKAEWQNCRVIGISKDDDGEPAYVVEVYHNGTSSLSIEPYVKRLERGNPL
ncbi:hypothetical protein GOB17_28115 [Sinorhizobium meliloti]|uniref:hypothetical protein n=1 Tax=Rhizobium meliloti TaxID=382 RepID=UPI00299EA96A|nr:hypothetical protein [Sinorhizobium meliloti]